MAPVSLLLVALASFGGPLALAGLYGPQAVDDVTASSGWVVIAAIVAFAALLAIWLRFSKHVTSPAGLSAFVMSGLGRPAGIVHAAVWTGSYALYLTYTSAYVVYDLLPVATPSVHDARPWLAIVLPLVIAALLLGGRAPMLSAIGIIAVAQIALLVITAAISVSHTPSAHAFTSQAAADDSFKSAADVGGLFVCGSLPLFLGGEVRNAVAAMRRSLLLAFGVTALLALLVIYPYAAYPYYTHQALPAMTVIDSESSHALAVAVGLGIAASVVGVMLVEGLALTRLVHAITGRSPRLVAVVVAAALAVAGPISLLDPNRFYDDLLRPSLILLWIAQFAVVVAFAAFVVRRRLRWWVWLPVTVVAGALTGYALFASIQGGGST